MMNLSFSGCGFLGIYHLGVAKTLVSEGKHFVNMISRFGGSSAGALIASLLAVHGPNEDAIELCRQFCIDLAEDIKSKTFGVLTPGVELLNPIAKFLEEQFPHDAHIRASGRLFISVTNAETKENEIISEFSTRDQLIKLLLASSCVPYITNSKSIRIGNKRYFDGGLTNNMPLFYEGETICVSPFEGKHEICPSISQSKSSSSSFAPSFTTSTPSSSSSFTLSASGLYPIDRSHVTFANQNFKLCLDNLMRGIHIFSPPSVNMLKNYYRQGREDARTFLISRGFHDAMSNNNAKNNNNDETATTRRNDATTTATTNSNDSNNSSVFCRNCNLGATDKCLSLEHYDDACDDFQMNSAVVESSVDAE